MIYPNWKIILAEKHVANGTLPSEDQKDVINLVSVLSGTCDKKDASREIEACYEIYKKYHFTREIIEGCFLCEDARIDDIMEVSGLSELRLQVYRMFFFDTSVFKFRLLKFEYVSNYNHPKYPEGKNIKQWALGAGINFYKWRTKVHGHELIPKEIAIELAGDAFYRAKQQLDEPITSATAKEAMKWTKMALDSVSQLQRLGQEQSDQNALANVRIALKRIEFKETQADISDAEIIS